MIFHILPWKIPNNFTISEIRNFYIDNIRTFIMWEETKVLLIEMDDSIIKNQHFEPNMQIKYLIPSVLTVDAAVDDIIQVGMLIYCLDTNGALYELKHTLEEPSRSAEEDMFCPSQDVKIKSFKFTKSIKLNGVLKLQALRKGFTLVKKQHDKGFLNIYTFQGSITKASKAFSIEIPCPLLKTGNVQCFLATHTAMSFEPKFLELLIGNIPEEDIEIVFMGLGSYVFILAVDLVTKQTPVLKLLFHSAHSVANILPLKGTSSKFCSHIAIIISTGSVVSVTPDPVYKSLEYATAYLPTHVATVCGVHDKILCGDKVDLWLCQIQGDTHVDMKCKMLPNKGVTAVCTIVGTSNAVAVTSYGNMYKIDIELCLNEERDSLVQMSMETDVESSENSDIFEAICSATKQLETLSYEIAKENRILEGISLAMRVDHLKTYFQVNVKVHDTGHFSSYIAEEHNLGIFIPEMEIPNRLGNYILEMDIVNSTNQIYDSPTWSLNVCVNIEKESFINMIPLTNGLSKNHPFKLLMPISIQTPSVPVKLSCNLMSRLLRPSLESNRSWIIIPVADLTLDVSYFLTPRLKTVALRCINRQDDITRLTDDLLRMAQQNILGKIEINYVEQVRLNNNVDKKYELKLRHKTEPKILWVEVVKNCLHRNLKFMQSFYMEGIGEDVPRSLALYVGSYNLKMYFNPDCKTLTVLCTDLKILHAMKSYLLTLGLSKSAQRVVYIDSQLFTEAKQIEQELEPDKELLQRTLLSWRRCVSSYLPL